MYRKYVSVANNWISITDMTSAKHFDNIQGHYFFFQAFVRSVEFHEFFVDCNLYEISEVIVDLLNCAEKVSSENLASFCM